jgi:type I site-specific restriction endonuclease
MTPEEIVRQQIEAQLLASRRAVQTKDKINLFAGPGVAVCELSFATGEPDYTVFVDGKALGTVEAKPAGHSLVGVEEQSTKYVTGVTLQVRRCPETFALRAQTGQQSRAQHRSGSRQTGKDRPVRMDRIRRRDLPVKLTDAALHQLQLPADQLHAQDEAVDDGGFIGHG